MQAVPGAFDTKFLSLMRALRAAMARRVFAAAARSERDLQELKLAALSGIEFRSPGAPEVLVYCPSTLPVAHRCSS